MKIRYLINYMSLMRRRTISRSAGWRFPDCLLADPWDIYEAACRCGYDGVQGIPARGVTGYECVKVPLCEEAWNPVPNLLHALRHQPGAGGEPSGLFDWLFFPPSAECERVMASLSPQSVRQITHTFVDPAKWVEICSDLDMTPAEIAAKCRKEGYKLVLDPEHLVDYKHNRKLAEGVGGDSLRAIYLLRDYIQAVHVHPIAREGNATFLASGQHCLTGRIIEEFLGYARWTNKEILLVAEYNPGKEAFLFPAKSDELARQFLAVMKELVGDLEIYRRLAGDK